MENFTLAKHENYAEWYKTTRDFFDQASSTHSCYWIIDPCSSPELPAAIWELDPDANALPLYMNTYLEDVAQAGPMLIPYSRQSKLTAWLFQQMELRPLGYLVQAEKEDASELFEHLQNMLECTSPKGTKSLFRFYDPRVMYAVTTYNVDLAIEQLLGPVLYLHGWEYGRRTAIHAGDGTDHLFRCTGEVKYPEELFEHIWKEVKIHTSIEVLKDALSITYPNASFFDLYGELEKTYNYIMSYGFRDEQLFELAAAITADYSNNIWRDGRVTQILSERSERTTLIDVFGKIRR